MSAGWPIQIALRRLLDFLYSLFIQLSFAKLTLSIYMNINHHRRAASPGFKWRWNISVPFASRNIVFGLCWLSLNMKEMSLLCQNNHKRLGIMVKKQQQCNQNCSSLFRYTHTELCTKGYKQNEKKEKCLSLQLPPLAPKLNNCTDQSGDWQQGEKERSDHRWE